jgi:hypothetical protein
LNRGAGPATASVLAALAALAGCEFAGADDARVSADPVRDQTGPPLYWVGESFDGLPLTHAETPGPGRGVVAYGTCEPPGGTDGGCAVPLQIQHFPFTSVPWPQARGCSRLRPARGVPTVRHDGFVLFTGQMVVKIYSRSPAEDRRVAELLRPANRPGRAGAPLPAPPPEYLPIIAEACGARPGERGAAIGSP